MSSVITTAEIDTSNLQYMPHEQVTEKDVVKELNFKVLKEVINVYETNKSIIIVSPQLQKLFLTNKKDNKNNPILRYIMKSGVNILSKSMLAGNEIPENQEK